MSIVKKCLVVVTTAGMFAACTMMNGYRSAPDSLVKRCGAAECEENALVKDGFVRELYNKKGGESPTVEKVEAVAAPPETVASSPTVPNNEWCPVIQADALFDFDKYELKPAGRALLDEVAAALAKCPTLKLKMSGHTDNVGSMAYNTVLSQRRVEAGRDYLVGRGIAPERISVNWYSFTQPVATNDTEEGRAKNRRLELEYINGDGAVKNR